MLVFGYLKWKKKWKTKPQNKRAKVVTSRTGNDAIMTTENVTKLLSARFIARVVKPAIIWLILIYILLQLTVILNGSGTSRGLQSKVFKTRTIQADPTSQQKSNPESNHHGASSIVRAEAERIDGATKSSLSTGIASSSTDEHVPSSCPSDVKLVRGYRRKTKAFLTIGITTVPREGVSYLKGTLESLMSKILPEELDDTVIVIFLASMDAAFADTTLEMVDNSFNSSLASGLLQVIAPTATTYPDFSTITKRNFNDSLERVRWRTKQNLDFAALFGYCDGLSRYYIHVEDDIIVATGFIADIKKMVDRVSSPNYKSIWFEINFSTLGFIGRFYRGSDLCLIQKFLLLFQVEKPCDILINDLKRTMMQPKDVKNPKSLFQHVGKTSSLKGKIQNLTDKTFKDARRLGGRNNKLPAKSGNVIERDLLVNYKHFHEPNPPGYIKSTMEAFGDFKEERAYICDEKGFYWAKNPEAGSTYTIIYNSSVNIDAITVRTGHPKKFVDMLDHGSVRLSSGSGITPNNECGKFIDVGHFDRGQFYVHFNDTMATKCVEIAVTEKMKTWLIISEINIDTNATSMETDDEMLMR